MYTYRFDVGKNSVARALVRHLQHTFVDRFSMVALLLPLFPLHLFGCAGINHLGNQPSWRDLYKQQL